MESFQLRAILGFPVMSTCNLSLNSFCMYCSSQQVPGTGDLICTQHIELLTGGMVHLLLWNCTDMSMLESLGTRVEDCKIYVTMTVLRIYFCYLRTCETRS